MIINVTGWENMTQDYFLLYIQGFKGFYCHMLKKGGRSCDVLALALHTCNFAGWNKTVAPSPSRGHKTKLRGQET